MSETRTVLEFFVPALPPLELSPNARLGSPLELAAWKSDYRLKAKFFATGARQRTGWEAPRRARLTLTFVTCRLLGRDLNTGKPVALPDGFYRPVDVDNAVASFKAGLDGLVDARVLQNDRSPGLVHGAHRIEPEGEEPGVLVVVEDLDVAAGDRRLAAGGEVSR